MIEIISFIFLALVIVYQGYINWVQLQHYKEMESRLLDRIMTKSYEQYIQAEVAKEQAKLPIEPYEERGIPI